MPTEETVQQEPCTGAQSMSHRNRVGKSCRLEYGLLALSEDCVEVPTGALLSCAPSAVTAHRTARAPSRWCGPFPSVKGAHKGIDLYKAEQKRDVNDAEVRARE